MFLEIGVLIVGTIVALILYARWNYGVLEGMGLPVDKPHLFLGNTYYTYKTPGGLLDIDNFKRLGPIYGVYEGRQPQIHICDAELIRLITTKDADYFHAKRVHDFKDDLLNEMIDFQPYDKWKKLRISWSPQFSPSKTKFMSVSMIQTLEGFTEKLKASVESSPNKKLLKEDIRDDIIITLTVMLARCCYSLKIDNPSDPDNEFVHLVRNLLQPVNKLSPMMRVFTYSFPFLSNFLPPKFCRKRSKAIVEVFTHIMDTRKNSGEKKNDVLDFFVELMDKVDTPEFKRMNITKQTIVCQAFFLIFFGQDQISSILATMIYYLLQTPELEKSLYQELDTVLAKHKGKIDYEILSDFPYLLACITEAVRLAPFFSRTERVCTKNWKNEEFNLEIKKGTVIQIPMWAVNRNPKYFSEAETFNPDRFLPGNKEKLHPYAMTSFGFGPRNCLAQKFAYDIMLLFCIFLFKNFKFHLREDSKPVYFSAPPGFTPHFPFYFDVSLRN